jgi:U32 family peptidase
MNHLIELLAPAGDPEKLRAAIQYGANAVYLSLRDFSLRAAGGNFTPRELSEAVAYAHARQVKVYLALNYLAHPTDMERLRGVLLDVLGSGAGSGTQLDPAADDKLDLVAVHRPDLASGLCPDAVIVADPGVFSLVREICPSIKIHISTQASVTNAAACRFWHSQGASRIILARELTLAEIRDIRAAVPESLELEAFVHGAMCMAYSGRCLLSAHLSRRDSNRGRCSQPCRWRYQVREVHEASRPDLPLDVESDERGSFIFNSKDLCMIEHIPELLSAGLSSLKIEGRVKSAFYVATVVKAYREALDHYQADPATYQMNPAWLEDLRKTVHRSFDTGFYFTPPQEDAKIDSEDTAVREAAVVGLVRAWLPDSHLALIEQRNKISDGEQLELVQPEGRHRNVPVAGLLDLERRPIGSTPHPGMLYFLPLEDAAVPGAFLRRLGDKDASVRS